MQVNLLDEPSKNNPKVTIHNLRRTAKDLKASYKKYEVIRLCTTKTDPDILACVTNTVQNFRRELLHQLVNQE